MSKYSETPWWAYIPFVGPVALGINEIVYAIDEASKAPLVAAIDTAATTQADAVTTASDAITTATDTATTGLTDSTAAATEGLTAATTAATEGLGVYSDAGKAALTRQRALLGLDGPVSQQESINAIAQGPEMAALTSQGENAILQGASATGGLRGGNVQGALAQFRPQLLSSLINQQYQNLSGISGLGYNAAAQAGNFGIQGAQGVGNFGIAGAQGVGNYGLTSASAQGDLAIQLAAIKSGQALSQAQLAQQSPTMDFLTKLGGYALGGGF